MIKWTGIEEQTNPKLQPLQLPKIRFKLAGWNENPIKSVVLTFPLDKIVFPAVTLCPRDSRPDRWGTVIKIFDQLNTNCGSKRWGYTFNSKLSQILFKDLREKIKYLVEIVHSNLEPSFENSFNYLYIIFWPFLNFLSNMYH